MQVPNPPGSNDALSTYAKGIKSGKVVLGSAEAGLLKRQLWSGRRIHVGRVR